MAKIRAAKHERETGEQEDDVAQGDGDEEQPVEDGEQEDGKQGDAGGPV
jgi:hypothetical protein